MVVLSSALDGKMILALLTRGGNLHSGAFVQTMVARPMGEMVGVSSHLLEVKQRMSCRH